MGDKRDKKPVTVRLDPDRYEKLRDRVDAADDDDRSLSDELRACIARGLSHDERIDELERENERLREQLMATNTRVDEHTELVEYVEHERRLDQRREQRRQAPAWRRAKWWLLGEPAPDPEQDPDPDT